MRRLICFLGWIPCFLVLGIVGLFLVYSPSRTWPAHYIYRSDTAAQADAIVVLMGSVKDRTERAAELWKRGLAPKIVFVEAEKTSAIPGIRPPDGESTYRYLQALGVPNEALVFGRDKEVSSTFEEAAAVFATIQQALPQARRVILVTSWYHSSRAHWIFEKSNTPPHNFSLSSLPPPEPAAWYQQEHDFLMVFNEYLKWAYYRLKY